MTTVLVIVYAATGGFVLAHLVEWIADVVIGRWVRRWLNTFDACLNTTPTETARAEKTLIRPAR